MNLTSTARTPHSFHTTRWSLVRQATGEESDQARQALEELCTAYWYPLYAFIRRSGRSAADAEDLTQGFFARLLDKDILTAADPERGRLRTFLLTCLRHYMAHEHERANAAKRDARLTTSLDADWAEDRYRHESADTLTPDRLYQRRWALTVLEYSLGIIEADYRDRGKAGLFDVLRPFLGFGQNASSQGYAEAATKLNMPEGTFKNHVFRLRQRWREQLFQQVGATLDDPTSDNIKAELAELMECL